MREAIIVASAARLPQVIAEHDPEIVVSLVGRGEAPAFDEPAFRHIHLECYDIPEDRGRRRAPGVFHVRRLIEVADAWTGVRSLLVHCREGVSRAPAAAFVIACYLSDEDEGAIRRRLSALAPWHRPHAGLVIAADAALRREGNMVEAMRQMHDFMHGSAGTPKGTAPRLLRLGRRRKPTDGRVAEHPKLPT